VEGKSNESVGKRRDKELWLRNSRRADGAKVSSVTTMAADRHYAYMSPKRRWWVSYGTDNDWLPERCFAPLPIKTLSQAYHTKTFPGNRLPLQMWLPLSQATPM